MPSANLYVRGTINRSFISGYMREHARILILLQEAPEL